MRRLIIICEGPTEIEFCKDFYIRIFLEGILLFTHIDQEIRRRHCPWPALKRQIENHLLQDPTASVTTFIDYYGIKENFEFPEWQASKAVINKTQRMTYWTRNEG